MWVDNDGNTIAGDVMKVLMLLPQAEKHERLISENEGSDHVSLPCLFSV
jgi:hypothetical protein